MATTTAPIPTPTSIVTAINGNEKSFTMTEVERLKYEIHRYSSYSPNYIPDNILVDCPNDQSSRWSAYTNNPPQYIILKLKRPAIVKKIKFGKFEKAHVCNIKKFRIYGGLEDEHMKLLLEGGLKNNNIPEVFNLRCVTSDGSENVPILYLKIVPLLSWGPSFNFSIWYIELHGQDDPMYTSARMQNYNKLREIEIIRLCLKHFRQQGYNAAFNALQKQTNVCLEHELIGKLYKCLVLRGDFERTEHMIAEHINEGLMDEYLNKQNYKHIWQLKDAPSGKKPGNRGGHQLVMDTQERMIYLYGGWDGYQDMSDLWVYDIANDAWTLLFEQTEKYHGPTPRSCHKMIYDPVSKNIFMLGRYLDNSNRTRDCTKSDFFLYDTSGRSWMQICEDTSCVGGPNLVYDHQMCLDVTKRTIYVFGGKILTPRIVTSSNTNYEAEYSGLFSYHIATNTWSQILVDCHHPSAAIAEVMSIKSRTAHCMVFHNRHRKLYIYGGQRGKEDIEDFLTYDVDNQTLTVINREHDSQNNMTEAKFEPSPGYTLRSTIDCDRNEIYIFSSLSKVSKDKREVQNLDTSNSFWVYSLENHKWSRIYYCRHNTQEGTYKKNATRDGNKSVEIVDPCPRYAHQLAYDDLTKVHYLFGGNPGLVNSPQTRFNDFWMLTLEKPQRSEIMRHCRYLVRKTRYEEMTFKDPIKAMQFLRENVAAVIDHKDPEQLASFHKLASLLFKPGLNSMHEINANTSALNDESYVSTDDLYTLEVPSSSLIPNTNDESSLESCLSILTSGISETASSSSILQYQMQNGECALDATKKSKNEEYNNNLKNRRTFLFNKLVNLMPAHMVQPDRNLSDFVVI